MRTGRADNRESSERRPKARKFISLQLFLLVFVKVENTHKIVKNIILARNLWFCVNNKSSRRCSFCVKNISIPIVGRCKKKFGIEFLLFSRNNSYALEWYQFKKLFEIFHQKFQENLKNVAKSSILISRNFIYDFNCIHFDPIHVASTENAFHEFDYCKIPLFRENEWLNTSLRLQTLICSFEFVDYNVDCENSLAVIKFSHFNMHSMRCSIILCSNFIDWIQPARMTMEAYGHAIILHLPWQLCESKWSIRMEHERWILNDFREFSHPTQSAINPNWHQ